MKSRRISLMLALLALGLGLVLTAMPADAGHVLELQVIGRGTAVGQSGTCFDLTFVPGCTLHVTGEIMGTHLGHGHFTLQIKTGMTPEVNADGGTCLPANRSDTTIPAQIATLTAANGDVIRFNTVGKLCEELAEESSYQYIADYRITGGTGRFGEAVGGGNLALTVKRTNGGDAFFHLHGTIRY